MKNTAFVIAIFVALLGLGNNNVSGQTRNISVDDTRKTGGSLTTEVLHINRTIQERVITDDFTESMMSEASDGRRHSSPGVISTMAGGHNTSYQLYSGTPQTGLLQFRTSESIAPRFGAYLSDIATQVVYRETVNGVVTSAKAHAVGDGTTHEGRNLIVQALNVKNSAFGISSVTGIEIDNPNGQISATAVLNDLFSSRSVTVTVTIPGGKSVLMMDQIFSGREIKDGNVELFFPAPVAMKGLRKDNDFTYEIPVFVGRNAYKAQDIVTIKSVVQAGTKLKVKAFSSDPEAYLTVTITMSDGTVKNLGRLQAKYKKIRGLVISVTVTSDFGGSATASL